MCCVWCAPRRCPARPALTARPQAVTEKPEIFDELELDPKVKATLIDNLRRRLTPQPVKIRADIEVACYAYEGINAIKKALRAGLELSTADLAIKINLIAPPLYVVTTVSLDREAGVDKLKAVLARIDEVIGELGGELKVKMEPRAVTEYVFTSPPRRSPRPLTLPAGRTTRSSHP